MRDGRELRQALEAQRSAKLLEGEIAQLLLEYRHFTDLMRRQHVAVSHRDFPLLHRSVSTLLKYLIDTQTRRWSTNKLRCVMTAIRDRVRYGSLKGIDSDSSDDVLRIQQKYLEKVLDEKEKEFRKLGQRVGGVERRLERYSSLSKRYLSTCLFERYSEQQHSNTQPDFTKQDYQKGQNFRDFLEDYPVILSTCHSLGNNLPKDYLLDYVIIDEASQVSLPVAVLALAHCKNVVIVGDQKQLEPVLGKQKVAFTETAPASTYDCPTQSILTSMIGLYGNDPLHYTLLREHYRCNPEIIGFCNEEFYDRKLIAYTEHAFGDPLPLVVYRTEPGNHMRVDRSVGRSGGHVNMREVDVIEQEVLRAIDNADSAEGKSQTAGEYGIITPYRLQAYTIREKIPAEQAVVSTVHAFQGRQCERMIFSTVLDETKSGNSGIRFVDDPHLINVAVSRAEKQFIVVTDYDMLPSTRYIRDLIGYIAYHHPDQSIVDSKITSIFDLLYQSYSKGLEDFRSQVHGNSRYLSENIGRTAIEQILSDEKYTNYALAEQILVRSVLKDFELLDSEQLAYVRHRASFDFIIYNAVTRLPVLAVEVDGWAFHDNNPQQKHRDELKNAICDRYGLALLRLSTASSGEEKKIRDKLDAAS